ncbi:MAG TPA: DUF3830 family protein [Woeseiaceae bacterium]|nr:DUF3830 family protein [Woeseiaceae bacterium]
MSTNTVKHQILLVAALCTSVIWSSAHAQDNRVDELVVAPTKAHDVEQIEIQIGDDVFIADLLWEKAPKTAAAIVSILPYEGVTYHQFWSGQGLQVHDETLKKMSRDHGLWPNSDFPDYSENPWIYGAPGEVGFYVVGYGLFLTYGKARFFGPPEGVEPTYIFAKIHENLERFEELGREIGRRGQKKISMRAHKP